MTGPAFRQTSSTTTDPDEGHADLRDVYVENQLRLSGSEIDVVLDADLILFAGTAVGHTRHSTAAVLDADHGGGAVTIARADRRPATIGAARQQASLAPGRAVVLPPHTPSRVEWDTLDSETTVLDQRLIDDVAAGLEPIRTPGPTPPVRFSSGRAITPPPTRRGDRRPGSYAASHGSTPPTPTGRCSPPSSPASWPPPRSSASRTPP